MKCPKCGNEGKAGMKFCPVCGTPIEKKKPPKFQSKQDDPIPVAPKQMPKNNVSTGFLVWFWFCFVVRILSTLYGLRYGFYGWSSLMGLIANIAVITGIGLILFARKKVGIFVIIGGSAFSALLMLANQISYYFLYSDYYMFNGSVFFGSFTSLAILIGVSYYFVQENQQYLS